MGDLGDEKLRRRRLSLLPGNFLIRYSWPGGHRPAIQLASTESHQCWSCRALCWLACPEVCPRTNTAAGGRESRRWLPGREKKGCSLALLRGWRGCALLGWFWSMKSVTDEESGSPQLSEQLLHLLISGGIEIERLQLHLPSPVNNRCESGIERVSGPTGPVWSSNSLYPWIDGGCCGQWGQNPRICSLSSSAAKSWRLQQ